MHNSFWCSIEVSNLLVYGFNIKSVAGIVLTSCCLTAFSFILEWLKLMQARYKQKELFLRARQVRNVCPSESSTLLGRDVQESVSDITVKDRVLLFGHELILWISLQNLSYLLMLCVMVYNAWFIIAVVIGGTIGYFIFGQQFMKINLQNCQVMRDTYCMLKCDEPVAGPSESDRAGNSTPALQEVKSCHEHTASASVHASLDENS